MFQYRTYPIKKQQRVLESRSEAHAKLSHRLPGKCCNALGYAEKGQFCCGQPIVSSILKQRHYHSLNLIHLQVLQNVVTYTDLALHAFYQHRRKDEQAGYPDYQDRGYYASLIFPHITQRSSFLFYSASSFQYVSSQVKREAEEPLQI